ncbi:hypothetical protein FRC10_007606, partial [Ceratobasidium sp. 414]
MNSCTAWNFATTEVMNDMRTANPSALADIEWQARDVCEAAARSYTEQDPDTLKEIVRGLEKQMATTAHQWGRSTGAAIYMVAMYHSADEGPKVV